MATEIIKPQPISEAEAKAKIYHHESGNVACKYNNGTAAGGIDCNYNGYRACGIGQALPCQKLTAVCHLSDYTCQDNWFTTYMQQRYGTWAKAWEYWNCTGYCTNKYGTIYKTTTWW